MLARWFKKLFKAKTASEQHTTAGQTTVSMQELLKLQQSARTLSLNTGLKTRRQIVGGFSSGFKGRGIDFAEVRDYQLGDDIRHMDWRVTARSGKPHTKLYEEEKECPVFIVVDYSPSMFFGSRQCFKSVVAAKAAALLAWAALQNRDRVGGLVFADNTHQELIPRPGLGGILPFLKNLADYSARLPEQNDPQALTRTLDRLRHLTRPGSRIFLISDFKNLTEKAAHSVHHLAQHNEIRGVFIYDPLEKELPPPNYYGISDGHQSLLIDTANKALKQQYSAEFLTHYKRVQHVVGRQKNQLLHLATTDNLRQCLAKQLLITSPLETTYE